MPSTDRRRAILAFLKLVQQYCASPTADGYQAVLAAAQELALRHRPRDNNVSQIGTTVDYLSQNGTAADHAAYPRDG